MPSPPDQIIRVTYFNLNYFNPNFFYQDFHQTDLGIEIEFRNGTFIWDGTEIIIQNSTIHLMTLSNCLIVMKISVEWTQQKSGIQLKIRSLKASKLTL